MKSSRILLLSFALCLAVVCTNAQNPPKEFVCGEGRFAVSISDPPYERKDISFKVSKYDLSGESITWKDANQDLVELRYFDVYGPDDPLTANDKLVVLKEYKKSILDELGNAKMSVTESPYEFEGFRGIEIKGGKQIRLVSHLFFTKTRFIDLIATKRGIDSFDPIELVLNSFRFLSKPEYSAALIAENTPATLPQTGGIRRPRADLSENHLMGKVRQAVTESQETSKSFREPENEEYYDTDGYMTKSVAFYAGYPLDITRWGWIDGMRVSNGKSIEYGMHEGPNENQPPIMTIMSSPISLAENAKKSDDRYTNRYDYKYDTAGRITERTTYQNDQTVWIRDVLNYTARQREIISYEGDGSLNQKVVETLDDLGNVIEERQYDLHDKLESITQHKYEFDTTGNWVIKRDFKKSTVRGKTTIKPSAISYRQIIYY